MEKKTVSGLLSTLLLLGMSTLAFNIQPIKLEPAIWTVDDDGPADFHTIQEAINIAIPGDTIFVYSGTYYENIVINKTVSLVGEKRETTVIDAKGTGNVVNVSANEVIIEEFTIRNGGYLERGIYVRGYHHTTIRSNNVKNNWCGIYLSYSSNNTISGNNVTTNNDCGIYLYYSSNNTLRNNHMSGNQYDFHVGGWKASHFIHDIDSSNTVSDKPVYYWINHQNERVPVDAGYVALINSTNITAQNLDLKNNGQGVLLVYTKNSSITGNNITNNNGNGIGLYYSSNNGIYGNNITNNFCAIYLSASVNNTISGNNITAQNYEYGIFLLHSFNNVICGNKVERQWCGINLSYSSNNTIHHNNIINNNTQVYSYGDAVNVWDDGYPSGGNYWSDYEERYPNATEIDDSGIWDTPYVIDENNQDHYPFMNPWTPPPPIPPPSPTTATVDVNPDTLNLKSKGRWITVHIELPEGYNVSNIDRSTILLNDTIPVDSFWLDKPHESVIGDYDNDGIPDLMVKFDRAMVSEFILSQCIANGVVTLTLTGDVNGTSFEGADTIRVLMGGG